MPGIYRLRGTVKHYDWGGTEFIPELLNKPNEAARPWAEYWLGTHSQDNSRIEFPDGNIRPLKDFLREQPVEPGKKHILHLPYLLKILDVKNMLSIQVHPSKQAAEKEFARENAEGIPMDAANRNYKDDNHKPELIVALGEFWLLHGFKPENELRTILKAVTELSGLLPLFENEGYAGLYRHVMEMSQYEVNNILQPLVDRVIPLYNEKRLSKTQESFWAARAAIHFNQPGKIDRGIFSIYFFNLLQLKKGEGIYQSPGVPHAYLEGKTVEIMASSDNVLRGGLTSKHIDVKELLKHVICEPVKVEILTGESNNQERTYPVPAPDFLLSEIVLKDQDVFNFYPATAEILLLVSGSIRLKSSGQSLLLKKGDPAAICFPGETASLEALEDSSVFRASVSPLFKTE